jgi:hypothetical protein
MLAAIRLASSRKGGMGDVVLGSFEALYCATRGEQIMSKLMTGLLVACVVASTETAAAIPEPRVLLCHGKAISPTPGTVFDEVSLSATINYDQEREVALIDHRTQKQESPAREQLFNDVIVKTGSLTIEHGDKAGNKTGDKAVDRMLWQRAGVSRDFIGFVIGLDYMYFLQVDSSPYEHGRSTQMPFKFFDGMSTILYEGTCAAH